MIEYTVLTVGAFEVNCAIIWSSDTPKAWVVDPGADAEQILTALRQRNLSLTRIILTHGHIDHISGLEELITAFPTVPVSMHAEDMSWAFSAMNRFPPYLTVPAKPDTLESINEGDVLSEGGLEARVLHTPGHSPGCICLHFEKENLLLTGDTLFANSVGRTDLPGGNGAKLAHSLRRLAKLPDEQTIIPGHGPTTTLATECRHNPYLARCKRR